MKNYSIAKSRRIRSTPYTSRIEKQGVTAYTVYNHMLLPAAFGSVEDSCNNLKKNVQVWDVAAERQVEIYGKDAAKLVQLMTCRDLSKSKIGRCYYCPIIDDNGNGMHVHQSLFKDGENLFLGNEYGGLSKMALHYIGGIIKHAKAINAFANASTNSYKRLVPGFEAPTILTYSAKNRSASIRIPFEANEKARRIEVRFPDSCGNPYLAFTALMMAGLDGIKNQIDPGQNMDIDLFDDLSPEEEAKIPHVCSSLDEALKALDEDRDFLKAGGVFDDETIDAYIALKMEEVQAFQANTHPLEFEMYYSL